MPTREPFTAAQLAELERMFASATVAPVPRAIAATGRIPDVVDGELIESAWGNAIRDRTVTPFATGADRDAATPQPPPGALCVTLDTGALWRMSANGWTSEYARAQTVALAGTIPNSVSPVTIGTFVVPPEPGARMMVITASMAVSTTATAVFILTVTSSAGGAPMIGRNAGNSSSVSIPTTPIRLPADTATTLTATGAFATAPAATGTVMNGLSRMDVMLHPSA